jgi:hypothetical protein
MFLRTQQKKGASEDSIWACAALPALRPQRQAHQRNYFATSELPDKQQHP